MLHFLSNQSSTLISCSGFWDEEAFQPWNATDEKLYTCITYFIPSNIQLKQEAQIIGDDSTGKRSEEIIAYLNAL